MELSKDERLAALLDGRCTEEERRELMAELAAGGEDLEIFAEAAAVLYEMEEEDRAEGVIPLRPPAPVPASEPAPRLRPPRRWLPFAGAGGLALAAGIAGLIVLPQLRERSSGAAEVVAMLHEPATAQSQDPRLPWDATRGSDEQPGLSDAQHVRLGALLVVLEVSARTDTAAAHEAARQIARLLERTTNPGNFSARYQAMSDGRVAPGELDPKLARRAEKIAGGGQAVRLGEWLQAARIAAERSDTAYFNAPESRAWLKGKGVPARMWQQVEDDFQRAREELSKPSPVWNVVQTKLNDALKLLGR